MRLALSLLAFAAVSPVLAATPWIAHFFPVAVPGSPGSAVAQPFAVDASGNIFASAQGCVFKLDPQGNHLGQLCYAPSGLATGGTAAIDAQGNLIIAGTTNSPASLQLVSPLISQTGPEAGFIIKFNSSLTQIVFATLLGGTSAGSIGQGTTLSAMAVDPSGNIYVSGWTADGNFPLTAGAYQTTPPADVIPAYVAAISPAGDKILWSTLFGGPKACTTGAICANAGSATVSSIAVDATGAAVFAGYSNNEQVPVTAGVLGPTCQCPATGSAAFVAKLAAGGAQLSWATYINDASIAALILDSSGNVIIGGQAYPGFTATNGSLQAAFPPAVGTNPVAGFAAKIDSSAQQYLFATFMGSTLQPNTRSPSGPGGVGGLAIDSSGTVWVTGGATSGLPLPRSVPTLGLSYIVGLSADGSRLTSAMTVPAGGAGAGVAVLPQGPVVWGPSGSILIPTSGAPASLAGIANSAGPTAGGVVAPNEMISFYGPGLGPSPEVPGAVVSGALTTALGGVQVQFDGFAAPLLYAGPNQINAIVPSSVSGRSSTTVTIVTPEGQIARLAFSVAPSAPEVFTYGLPGSAAIAMNEDWTVNSATNPAVQGSIVTVWASGAGMTENPEADGAITGAMYYPLALPLVVGNGFPGALSIGPSSLIPTPQVQYYGDAPELVKGATQVNFQIPTPASGGTTPPPHGPEEFYLQVGSALSDPFTVFVQ